MWRWRAPRFWERDGGWQGVVLQPLAWGYGAAARLRGWGTRPFHGDAPLICVGNFTAGGGGKTPVALSVAAALRREGRVAHMVAHGYGGRIRLPLRVDPCRHDAGWVGDESLLLARVAPTWTGRPRAAVVRQASPGAEVIVMDDGWYDPSLHKDAVLAVVDGSYGFGNGRVLPAGPLRRPLREGLALLRRQDAVALMGRDEYGVARLIPRHVSVLRARRVLAPPQQLARRKLLAVAGIARPRAFFAMLEEAGFSLIETLPRPDHAPWTKRLILRLARRAQRLDAVLVTTCKDYERLPAAFRPLMTPVPLRVVWDDEKALSSFLRNAVAAHVARVAHVARGGRGTSRRTSSSVAAAP